MPLLSVVTVTYNAASTLEDCIQSVLALKGEDVEFVVIDGNSKDGTVAILERYGTAIDVLVSEPDKGIYDAMNKGLDRASGDFVLFLGADDVLLHIPRQELAQGADLVLGDVDCSGWIFRHRRPERLLRDRMRYRNSIHPQGTFYRNTDIRYDLAYRFCSDYDFNLQYLSRPCRIIYCDRTISRFAVGGASSGFAPKREISRIAKRREGIYWGWKSWAYGVCSTFVGWVKNAY